MTEIVNISGYYTQQIYSVIEETESLMWIGWAGIRICALVSDKEKTSKGRPVFAECICVKSLYKPFVPYDFLIVIYEPNCAGLSDDQKRILLHHELLHVGMNEKHEETVYTVNPHDVEDFREIINTFGLDWSGR